MDYLRDTYTSGRRDMIDAFVEISNLARQAGVDPDHITALHGVFFDGNVKVKTAFGALFILAGITEDRL